MRNQGFSRGYGLILYSLIFCVLLAGCSHPRSSGLRIKDPYASIDWENGGRFRANFHTHTTESDGAMPPREVIDHYHRLGYGVLAITDHNKVTYPWKDFASSSPGSESPSRQGNPGGDAPEGENRCPGGLGMVAVQGNELSSHHHMGSFFSDHNATQTEIESLEAVGAKGGLAMFYHPGRYALPVEWYADLYRKYPFLVGLEVFNQGDRYSGDRVKWDAILSELMPDRPVWGYSNDDMHQIHQLGRNYSIMLLPELTEEWVRKGLEQGLSYFVYSPEVNGQVALPVIESIAVDHKRGSIRIRARGEHETIWISNGSILHRGDTIQLGKYPVSDVGDYVRAELLGDKGVVVGTQPFGIFRSRRIPGGIGKSGP